MSTAAASATTVLGQGGLSPFEFHNLGPLTTVFTTPAAECTAVPIASSGLAFFGQPRLLYLPVDNCEVTPFNPECEAGGEDLEKLVDDDYDVIPWNVVGYHSPGLHCPSGWETVGVIAMNNGTPSATGLFSPTVFTYVPEETLTFPPIDFVANMFTSVLGPTETGVACCPSGYTADPWANCYSNFPVSDLAGETVCRASYTGTVTQSVNPTQGPPTPTVYTFTYFDTTTTGEAYNLTALNEEAGPTDTSSENYLTITVTFDSTGIPLPTGSGVEFDYELWVGPPENRTGVAQRSPIFLIQPGGQAEEGEGEGGEDKPASAGRVTPAAWTTIGAVMAAWGVGMVAGVGLLAAW